MGNHQSWQPAKGGEVSYFIRTVIILFIYTFLRWMSSSNLCICCLLFVLSPPPFPSFSIQAVETDNQQLCHSAEGGEVSNAQTLCHFIFYLCIFAPAQLNKSLYLLSLVSLLTPHPFILINTGSTDGEYIICTAGR